MWKEFNLINSFTLESTFCGPSEGRYQDCHFTIAILKECGQLFCRTLIDYASNEPKVREVIRELETMFPSPKPEEAGGLSQHFNNNVDHDGKDENDKRGKNRNKKTNATKGGKDSGPSGKGFDKAREFASAMENGINGTNNGYRQSYTGGADKTHLPNHAPSSGNFGGKQKRMKSKKSGHKSAQEDGFHSQNFGSHHGIVGVNTKNGGSSNLPLVTKNTGGS
jgi:hypothetical protein